MCLTLKFEVPGVFIKAQIQPEATYLKVYVYE